MLQKIGDLTWHHPRKVLVAAFLFAAVAAFFGHDVEHHLKAAGFTDPASESEQAGETLAEELGFSAEPGLVVLVRSPDDAPLDTSDPEVQAELDRLAGELAEAAYLGNVTTVPADDGGSVVLAAQLTTTDIEDEGGLADESVRERVTSDLLDVRYGGFAPSFNESTTRPARTSPTPS